MEIFKSNKVYNFMGRRLPFLGFSSILFIASIVLLLVKGLNFGIDFAGGTIVQVKYEKAAPISDIRDVLKTKPEYANAIISKFGSDEEVVIRLSGSSSDLSTDISDKIHIVLDPTGNFEVRRVDIVGPKVGNELREKGLMALGLSIIIILIYVSYRFEWRFAVASILALVHDITIALGAISLFSVEVNLDILAAILTILGYSLNDTIIVFDRIREGVQSSKETALEKIVNESVSMTLSRTTLTSLTTFFVVATLFAFGGEIIHGFAFTLLVGIVVGTYSSIFIAASFLVQLKFSIADFRAKEAEKVKRQKEKEKIRAMYEKGTV
ncbi:protein-export membrane protein SecF [Malaciobacter marinus]|uniref:Protein-export membrane protein SecF n=2 Tax=Malaciobacter TaxID=2321114 RepID=A0A347TI59_9BACT|nr:MULTISPECIES: protein translocase subunit SecF [Malaciobacter]AXX86287.1 protein-export membrane protein SecF [Malaciobacter marinus]PHO10598.1 protein translocase subunit SecF [Malaciobacter canalis]PHO11786.1 protein translocase subunit SecF [Malaciobacter marinus]PHO15676.1 protein translocase subunit SecF [Malaciobacter marinus]QEE32048.1 protein-export membrane protein SecF [Malaciobacter canalis]